MKMAQRMKSRSGHRWQSVAALAWVLTVGVLAGCASPVNRAPVEDRNSSVRPVAPPLPLPMAVDAVAKPLPGAENAGKPGYYTVKPGDTLIRVGLENGQNWKDLVRWNSLDNPNIIEVGQVLRVVAPGADATAAGTRPVVQAKVETRPLDAAKPGASAPLVPGATPAPIAPVLPVTAVATAPAPVVAGARDADDDVPWMWPAAGPVATPFNDSTSKGLAIGGKAGDPVVAAADGRVIYAGAGLRGYGNLVILKHNNSYLTAYAHNQTLLVKDDQAVRRGQKIAEMGSTDADRVQLHFEIRKQGKPIDPAKLLPPR